MLGLSQKVFLNIVKQFDFISHEVQFNYLVQSGNNYGVSFIRAFFYLEVKIHGDLVEDVLLVKSNIVLFNVMIFVIGLFF